MALSTNIMLDEAAAACLVQMNSQQLNRYERDGASDALFQIYSGMAVNDTVQIKLSKSGGDSLAIPLASASDADNGLSPLQCYIRLHCVEYFEATESDADSKNSSNKHQQQRGRRSPIVLGRVGIRCVYCKSCPYNERASQSTAFPSNLEKIYSSVVMWQCRHLPQCRLIPKQIRAHLGTLKRGSASTSGASRINVWSQSAMDKGLVDTDEGIKYRPSSSSIEKDDEKELTRINEDPTTSVDTTSTATTLVTPKPIRPWVVSPDDFAAVPNEIIGSNGGNANNLFRPIRDDDSPFMEYESLKSCPLIDNKGRRVRVSVCLDDLEPSNFVMPAKKRSKR